MDPFLHSINHMLMEEAMEDAICSQQDGNASYQAILCSFYDLIGEHPPPPKSSLVSGKLRNIGFNILTHQVLNSGASSVSLPGNSHLQSSFFEEESTQNSHLQLNNGKLLDTEVSSWEKGKALNNFRSPASGRGSNDHFQLPSPYKELSLKLAGVELLFEDLKLHNHYKALYVGEPGIPACHPKYGDKEKAPALAGRYGNSGKKRTANVQEYVNLKDLIVNCGQAVAEGDARVASELLQAIQQIHGASAFGNGSQRAAHYFSDALIARMSGTGGHHFNVCTSAVPFLKALRLCFDVCPLLQVTHYFANQSILKAAEGASRLHIVAYGLKPYGMQWAFLINALVDQKGGPPLLVITCIDSPQTGNNPAAARLEESGRRLAAHARTYNVPFQYHAIASSKWEDLDSSYFHIHEDEVLVVNFSHSLRYVADESVNSVSPRRKLLTFIRSSLKPHLLIIADASGAYNSTFFVSRFREALYCFYNFLDMLDTVWGDIPERLLLERAFYSSILNIVACEGAERVVRPETYKQWQVCIKRAGFEQLIIPQAILSRSRSHVKQHYHKDFFVHDDANKWMLTGWRGRTLSAMSTWKLSD